MLSILYLRCEFAEEVRRYAAQLFGGEMPPHRVVQAPRLRKYVVLGWYDADEGVVYVTDAAVKARDVEAVIHEFVHAWIHNLLGQEPPPRHRVAYETASDIITRMLLSGSFDVETAKAVAMLVLDRRCATDMYVERGAVVGRLPAGCPLRRLALRYGAETEEKIPISLLRKERR